MYIDGGKICSIARNFVSFSNSADGLLALLICLKKKKNKILYNNNMFIKLFLLKIRNILFIYISHTQHSKSKTDYRRRVCI